MLFSCFQYRSQLRFAKHDRPYEGCNRPLSNHLEHEIF
jgi:hypothetical protein